MHDGVPPLSVIIAWCNRPEIADTLSHNAPLFRAHGAEVVVVNVGGRPAADLIGHLNRLGLPELRWIETGADRFNKCRALNLGVYVSHSPRLFFLDADILLPEDFLAPVLPLLDEPCVVTVARVRESRPAPRPEYPCLAELASIVEVVTTDGRRAWVETNRTRPADGSRAGPGLALMRREHFLQAGGMNSALEGWGWEDNDLVARLQLALGLPHRQAGSAVHLSHGDEARAAAGAWPDSAARNYQRSRANFGQGNFLGTYAADVAAWHDRLRVYAAGVGGAPAPAPEGRAAIGAGASGTGADLPPVAGAGQPRAV